MQMIADGKIKDGTKFVNLHICPMYDNRNVFRYEDNNFKGRYGGTNIIKMLNHDFEILEDTTEEIEELNTKGTYDYGELLDMYEEKINELIRFCNKLNNTTYKAENCMTD